MEYNLFTDLPQIHYPEDVFSHSQQWPYPHQFHIDSLGRPVQGNRAPSPFGFDLHLETGNNDLEPMVRFVHGSDQPFHSGYTDMKMKDLHISTAYESNSPIHSRQYSPGVSDNSSAGCETLSTCHSDEYGYDYRNGPVIESPDMSQEAFAQATYTGFTTNSPELPPHGGSCNLGQIQQFPEPPMDFGPDQGHSDIDGEGESDHEQDHIHCRSLRGMPRIHVDEDEVLGESIADSPFTDYRSNVDDDDEEGGDSEYKPYSCSSPRTSRSKRGVNGNSKLPAHSRKQSNASTTGRVSKPRNRRPSNPNAIRPFPCPLAGYGCISTFTSKNEWKRHVTTQHVKLGFWRCDMCESTDPLNQTHNDFNRKDLFTQHLRRMHTHHALSLAAVQSSSTLTFSPKHGGGLSEEAVAEHQRRCYLPLRTPPPQSNCLFCQRTFSGEASWDERMEHVGAHFEKERKSGNKFTAPDSWREDPALQDWLVQEGLVEFDGQQWRVGDGRPLRSIS